MPLNPFDLKGQSVENTINQSIIYSCNWKLNTPPEYSSVSVLYIQADPNHPDQNTNIVELFGGTNEIARGCCFPEKDKRVNYKITSNNTSRFLLNSYVFSARYDNCEQRSFLAFPNFDYKTKNEDDKYFLLYEDLPFVIISISTDKTSFVYPLRQHIITFINKNFATKLLDNPTKTGINQNSTELNRILKSDLAIDLQRQLYYQTISFLQSQLP